MFYDNLQNACKKNGITPTALVKKMEISTSNVTNWKKSPPSGDMIVRLSELLNVSCDYLLTGKDAADAELDYKKQQLLKCYDDCSNEGKELILQAAVAFSQTYNSKKDSPVPYMENKIG